MWASLCMAGWSQPMRMCGFARMLEAIDEIEIATAGHVVASRSLMRNTTRQREQVSLARVSCPGHMRPSCSSVDPNRLGNNVWLFAGMIATARLPVQPVALNTSRWLCRNQAFGGFSVQRRGSKE